MFSQVDCMEGQRFLLTWHLHEFIGKFCTTCNICSANADGHDVGGYMRRVGNALELDLSFIVPWLAELEDAAVPLMSTLGVAL
jgi:hypothetical protein